MMPRQFADSPFEAALALIRSFDVHNRQSYITVRRSAAEWALIQMAKMAKSKTIQLPVSARALKQRINRKLKPHQQLKEAREGSLIYKDCGRYFVIDHRIAAVLSRFTNLDLEKFGRELGVLSPAERLDDDKS